MMLLKIVQRHFNFYTCNDYITYKRDVLMEMDKKVHYFSCEDIIYDIFIPV